MNYGKNLIMKKINNFYKKNILKIINIFIILQPILDVVTAISINYFHKNITIGAIVRTLFLTFNVFYILFLDTTKNKKKNRIFLILFLIYLLFFSLIQLTNKDLNAYLYEIKNTINTFYLPIITISLLDAFSQYNIKFKSKTLLTTYLLYIFLVIFPNMTNTSFLSYSHSKLGNVGWFISANAVGNILSILLPIIFIYIKKLNTNLLIKFVIAASTLYVFASMGTKVPILSLCIFLLLTYIFYVTKWIKNKNFKQILISIIIFVSTIICSIIIIPKTTFYKNLEIHKNYLGLNSYIEVLTKYELIDHFIFSQRLTFLNNTRTNYLNSPMQEKLFGIGYIENYKTENESIKTIEIDYFDIIYRNGILGTIIYVYPFIKISKKIFNKLKDKTLENVEYKICLLLICLLSLFSGHVLIAPAVSIFVALIITIILKGGHNEQIN